MKKRKKNELVCPFCSGTNFEHKMEHVENCTNGVWEDTKETHTITCKGCGQTWLGLDCLEEFQKYNTWMNQWLDRFIIIVDTDEVPSIHIGVAFKTKHPDYGYQNFHPTVCSKYRMPKAAHQGKIFVPAQRESAISLYREQVKKYLKSLKKTQRSDLRKLLGPKSDTLYPEFWKEGMDLLVRLTEYKLDQGFAEFLRFLHEYDELVKDYPDEKDQREHLFVYSSWLYLRGVDKHKCGFLSEMRPYEEQEQKLLAEFKKTHK